MRVNRNYTLGDVLNYTNFVAAQKNEVYQLVDATTVRRIHRCHSGVQGAGVTA